MEQTLEKHGSISTAATITSTFPQFFIHPINFFAPASTWIFHHHLLRPSVTLTFDLQNLIRSSIWASEYYPSVLSKLFKPFMRHHGNKNKSKECLHPHCRV